MDFDMDSPMGNCPHDGTNTFVARQSAHFSHPTQQKIADLLNVGQRTYCDYELGKTRIPVDRLIVLAKYYNVDMNYISGISDKKKTFPKE